MAKGPVQERHSTAHGTQARLDASGKEPSGHSDSGTHMPPYRYLPLTHDMQFPLAAPVHVRHWEAHGTHSRVAASAYMPKGHDSEGTQVVPNKKVGAGHAVHCMVPAPVQAKHDTSHDWHSWLAKSLYVPAGQLALARQVPA